MLSGIGAQPLHQEVLRLIKRAMRPGAGFIDVAVARAMNALGVGQSWRDLTASRAHTVVYTNSLDRPIYVSASVNNVAGSAAASVLFLLDGAVNVGAQQVVAGAGSGTLLLCASAVVPAGSTYSLKVNNAALVAWSELR